MVVAHARASLTTAPEGACGYAEADLRDPGLILREAARTLDLTQPAALLLAAVLHFIPDADDPAGIVAAMAERLAPGSFVAISHLTADAVPGQVLPGVAAYNSLVPGGIIPRTHAQVTSLLVGLSLVAPGVVPAAEWRPAPGPPSPSADIYAGLALTGRRRRFPHLRVCQPRRLGRRAPGHCRRVYPRGGVGQPGRRDQPDHLAACARDLAAPQPQVADVMATGIFPVSTDPIALQRVAVLMLQYGQLGRPFAVTSLLGR